MIRLLPRWYRVLWSALGFVFAVVAVAYYIVGARAVRIGGAQMEFARDSPMRLFRIDDSRGFLVDRRTISVVRYEGANPLLYPCGCTHVSGGVVGGVDRQSGPWVYTSEPRFGADAVNVETGEVIRVDADQGDQAARQQLVARGLDLSPTHALSAEQIAATHEPLSLRKESCMDWILAFYALGILLLAIGPLALWRGYAAARRAARGAR